MNRQCYGVMQALVVNLPSITLPEVQFPLPSRRSANLRLALTSGRVEGEVSAKPPRIRK
jgi:hypothetical protein